MGGWVDGWMERDGWTDGQMDETVARARLKMRSWGLRWVETSAAAAGGSEEILV